MLSPRFNSRYFLRLTAVFVAALLVGFYLIFSPGVNKEFYEQEVLFRPARADRLETNWYGRKGREVWFTNAAGQKLSGLYFPCAGARRTLLFHHGMANNLNFHMGTLEHLMRPGTAIFAYDYAGFGRSHGKPSIAGMRDDARAAYDFLTQKLGVDPNDVVQFGISLGTGPAIALAAQAPCAGLVAISPYLSLKAAARDRLPFLWIYPDQLMTVGDFDSLASIKQVAAPILLIHGRCDATIPVEHGQALYEAARMPKTLLCVPSGTHSQLRDSEHERLSDWLDELHPGSGSLSYARTRPERQSAAIRNSDRQASPMPKFKLSGS